METLKFETRVSATGVIQLPENNSFNGRDVEVVVFPKENETKEKLSSSEFVKKWSGFLSNLKSDDPKYDYLKEKYK